MTELTIIILTTIFTLIPFCLYSYLSNKILKICLFLIAEVSLSIAIKSV